MKPALVAWLRTQIPEDRRVRFWQRYRRVRQPALLGTLRRMAPLSESWGYDRGTPVDRYYIEQFLRMCRHDIHGRVLEVKDREYTERFGIGVTQSDVLDIDRRNPQATVIADLSTADALPADQFDCFVLTQTLQFIYDMRAAIRHAARILRPSGVLLVTVPALSRRDRRLPDYWRFTVASCTTLFGEVFGAEQVKVYAYGNLLTAIAFLAGMAREELSRQELETCYELLPVVVAVRAVKQQPGERV